MPYKAKMCQGDCFAASSMKNSHRGKKHLAVHTAFSGEKKRAALNFLIIMRDEQCRQQAYTIFRR